MKRIRQHIIEDESESILKSIIPSEWVLRKLTPDYGIDYNVEIFENNQSTGIHFFVQLKGTDKKSTDGNISFRLDKKYIDYFGKVSIPILFVYISVKSNIAWAKWLNSCSIDKKNKSRALNFTSNDILDDLKINSIKRSLSVQGTLVRVKYEKFENAHHGILKKWVSFYFKECLITNSDEIADEIIITLRESSETKMTVNIKDERFLIDSDIDILEIDNDNYTYLPEIDEIPQCLQNILFEISKILLIRKNNFALNVALKLIPKLEGRHFTDIVSIVTNCIEQRAYRKLKKLCFSAIDNDNYDVFQFVYMAMFSDICDEDIIKIKEMSLLRAIDKSNDIGLSGTFCYNLANHYQGTGNIRESIKYYLKARKLEPDYLNRGYWFRELAGMLFLYNKYTAASKLYKVCITCSSIKEDPINIALAADACFMARDFKESLRLFELYATKVDDPKLEFTLKKQISKTVKDEFGFQSNYSQKKAVEKYKEYSANGSDVSNKQLRECLKHDPISPELRFNEGLFLKGEGRYEEACIAFLISAIVTEYYAAAWLNSFFMAFEDKSHMMGIVLKVAFDKCGYSLIESMRDEVLDEKGFPIELKTQIIDAMVLQFEAYSSDRKDNN